MIEIITSRGYRIEISDDRIVLHHKKSDELREFKSFEDFKAFAERVTPKPANPKPPSIHPVLRKAV